MSGSRPLVAFYAPMKAPDHPVPSGDRTVARLYVQALQKAGFDVEFPTNLRVYDGVGDPDAQVLLRLAADERAHAIMDRWRRPGARRPDLWFTYHVYHKSPDLIGPTVARWTGMPYAIAEPSHAPKRQSGPWSGFLAKSALAIRQADRVFVTTAADAACVAPLREGRGGTVRLPPFLDAEPWPDAEKAQKGSDVTRIVTLAMMRPGDKVMSYALLAQALLLLAAAPWTLTIVGDGPARAEVEALFAGLGPRVRFTGLVEGPENLGNLLKQHDVFAWPAVKEAYGMAPLEAQLMGLPVVLGDEGGVREVLVPGETGLLARSRDAADFARHLAMLVEDKALAARMGAAARRFVLGGRSLESAAETLSKSLFPLIQQVRP